MQIQTKWTDAEKQILCSNYQVLTYKDMETLLPGRSWYQIRNQANYLGLTQHSNLGRKYSANKSFFSDPNEINSYWAGFIAADGGVIRNRLTICLHNKDKSHLENFKRDIKYTGRVVDCERNRVYIGINCKEMIEDLRVNFSITECKSLTLTPPSIHEESYVKAFILGLIDGDGNISFRKKERAEEFRISIYGTESILNWVKHYFDQWTIATNYNASIVRKISSCNLYSYSVNSKRAAQIAKTLLQIDVPVLGRKWDAVRSVVFQGEVEQLANA